MVKTYKLKRRSLYYKEEKSFKNFMEKFIWMTKLKLSGWQIEKLSTGEN